MGKVVFEDFERLSGNVWLLDKHSEYKSNGNATASASTNGAVTNTLLGPESTTRAKQQPDLVILATWMGADARHIKKYILGYRQLFPQSSFLVIRNDIADVTFRPRTVGIRRIQPALTVIERFFASANNSSHSIATAGAEDGISSSSSSRGQTKPNIMLHMYSNGGANQARILAQLWRQRHQSPLPVSSMIFDSCPGIENYRTTLAAFIIALPKFFLLRYILLGFIHVVLIAHYVANHFLGAVSFLRRLRKDLNDSSLFPKSAPRCYIYSKTDEMVEWRDVESHAEDAQRLGWKAKTDRFSGSKHVGHLIADKERYWDDVQGMV